MIKNIVHYLIITIIGQFDPIYYLSNYLDVRRADIDPLWHYVTYGWIEGRNPSPLFDTKYYLDLNLDVKKANVNPYIHYIMFGKKENRRPSEMISSDYSSFDQNYVEGAKSKSLILLIMKTIKSLANKGIIETVKKIKHYAYLNSSNTIQDNVYNKQNCLSDQEIWIQKNAHFTIHVTFSILVPLYNTPPEFLKDLMLSVFAQTYTSWELCIADGSDEGNDQIQELMKIWTKNPKVKYTNLGENKGIAMNTVAAYEMATGDFLVLLDHDDILTVNALFELASEINNNPDLDIIFSDRAIFSNKTKNILAYHFLPGYCPDFLRSNNYMSHLIAYSQKVIKRVGFERRGYEGSQDYELLLRCTENARKISHIPKVLYLCRASSGSVALNPESKIYAYSSGEKAISEHITRIGYPGKVQFIRDLYAYRIDYQIPKKIISIIIPNKDHIEDLKKCLNSILTLTTYNNYEILIVENNSTEKNTFEYYEYLKSNPKIRILEIKEKGFNYSAINNFAVNKISSEFILLLNNDVTVITPSWIEELLMFAQRRDVGAVGAKLLYPDNTIQHCGLVIGLNDDIANNYGHKKNVSELGYMNKLVLPQNYSALTAACMMVKRSDYIRVGGMDESEFKIGLNDLDFCLKLRELGLNNVWTPYAVLYHYESKTRGSDQFKDNKARYQEECIRFRKKWQKYFLYGDPFNNKNFKGW